jgi:DNA-binding response OmpR family regulator
MIVVLVDDDVEDLEWFCHAVLEVDKSIDCICFKSGQELLLYLADENIIPDFIFLDFAMPIMGGLECLREIRSHKKFDSAETILYSSSVSPRQIETLQNLKARLLLKPYEMDVLIAEIRKIIKTDDPPGTEPNGLE